MAAATGAETMQSAFQQQQQAAFDALHGELVAEALAVATEFRVNVRTVAFLPDGYVGSGGSDGEQPQVAAHEFPGIPPEVRARKMMRRLVAKDVSRMGNAELAQHAARLLALRAAVVRKLREKEEKKTAAAGGEGNVMRALEQQQETSAGAAGFAKIRRVE
ncbi:hypothetical protein EJB05_09944, partial [Eragrostis curvula]